MDKLDQIVAKARLEAEKRGHAYREQALNMFPWICTRCQREFTRENLRELTVHHKDHNHDNNPPDGSNWELLCIYCHDHEHSKYLDATAATSPRYELGKTYSTGKPFADLKTLMDKKEKD